MTDIVDRETRSRMMSGIRGRNTRPEMMVRKGLHARGFRYRLHDRKLPGAPDLVLPRHRTVVFVHGCFWHRHRGCSLAATPATRPEFWQRKFRQNVDRDRKVKEQLMDAGWRVMTVWECGLRKQPDRVIDTLAAAILDQECRIREFPSAPESGD